MKSHTSTTTENKYWIIVASKDHVMIGVKGDFCQANHGKKGKLQQMKKGDGVVFYSSRQTYGEDMPLQKFTAIGTVKDNELYQGIMGDGFEPYRRNIKFIKSKDADIKPLIESLSFIKNKSRWGYMFRFGLFEITEEDFERIKKAMRVKKRLPVH